MHYIKSLCFNCLTIFLSLHLFAGVEVTDATRLPHVGGDLLLAAGLGFLNSLIHPLLKMASARLLTLRIFIFALALNFAAFTLVKFLPLGISINALKGYALAALVASVGSFLANAWDKKKTPPPQLPPLSEGSEESEIS